MTAAETIYSHNWLHSPECKVLNENGVSICRWVGDVTCGVKDLNQDLMLVGTRVALQCSRDVKRELIIPAQSAAGLQAWYRIARARGLPGVIGGYMGLQGLQG